MQATRYEDNQGQSRSAGTNCVTAIHSTVVSAVQGARQTAALPAACGRRLRRQPRGGASQ